MGRRKAEFVVLCHHGESDHPGTWHIPMEESLLGGPYGDTKAATRAICAHGVEDSVYRVAALTTGPLRVKVEQTEKRTVGPVADDLKAMADTLAPDEEGEDEQ